jgi:pyrroline-5-carboxylate reductase
MNPDTCPIQSRVPIQENGMTTPIISFIGAGNMAKSLIGGLIADGCDASRLWAADPEEAQLAALRARHPVHTTRDNAEAARVAEVLVFAVKPQQLRTVAQTLAPIVSERQPLVVTIAAGVRATDLERWLGGAAAIVRAMPNTPALVQSGATALHANARVSGQQRDQAEAILRAVGLTLWLDDEALMDAVTALSGSGPAYYFLVMEALEQGARTLGLDAQTARLLTLQTAFGAAKMALESSEDAATLRARVTSKGGTTEQALRVLEEGQLRELFAKALAAARDRSRELAQMLGSDD